jgi:hypothetical protein
MKSRALWLSLCLAAVGTSVSLRESVAAAKVDLEAYIGDVPMENDSRAYLSELGDDNIETAIAVGLGAKRSGIMFSATAAGDYVNEFDVVVHARSSWSGPDDQRAHLLHARRRRPCRSA